MPVGFCIFLTLVNFRAYTNSNGIVIDDLYNY